MLTTTVVGQTASTGALVGETYDTSGAVMPGVFFASSMSALVLLDTRFADAMGRFAIPVLPPGKYDVDATSQGKLPVMLKGSSVVEKIPIAL